MTTTLNRSVGITVPSNSSASVLGTLSTLVVFDSRVLGLDVLYGALLPEAIGYTIKPNDDALFVITQLLAETGAKQLSIVAHGEPGIVHIGAQPLNLQQITDRSALLQEWCLDEIALYSCEVGADQAFVAGLEGVTRARVAATTQQVGAEALGSNWELDGEPNNAIFDQDLIKDYPHTLIGTGLTGTYYDNINFTGTRISRLDSTINFDWGTGDPIAGIDGATFSVRWSGKIQPLYSETYTFITSTDDGVKLTINGQVLINDQTEHNEAQNFGTIDLVAGQQYDIEMEFFDNTIYAVARLSWQSTSQAAQIVPQSQLFPAAEASDIRHAGDFDGDGQSEILWRNNDGSVAVWELDGTGAFAITSAPIIASAATAPINWEIADTGDFNGDGKSEILWRNNDGSVAIWKLDGTSAFTIASAAIVTSAGVASTDWKISGTADFDGDGKSEILWRNNDGSVAIWKLDGTSAFTLASTPLVANATNAPTNWKISGTGDFDGDGKSEILWYNNTDGTVAIWKLDGTSAFTLASATIVGTAAANSQIKGIDDLDGDGKSEILWHNNNGSVVVWKLDGTSAFTLASTPVTAPAATVPTDWRASATGDFNGNGGSEILWRNTSGAVAVWELDGTSSFLPVATPIIASVPTDWVIAAPH